MNKKILTGVSSFVLTAILGVSQAAEVSLDVSYGNIRAGNVWDGARIATGRVVCRDSHTGFHIQMNAWREGYLSGHYLIRGKRDNRHELRVRLEGDGWYGAQDGTQGMLKSGDGEMAMFDVVADSKQYVLADEYVFSVTAKCF
ncbi:TPA: adhesin [Escherichia coli]|nr:adhesin [Escherichia coli]HBC0974488.1 adhesin [Escherichia coli]